MKGDKFPNTRKPSHQWVCGEFWNLRGQNNWEEKEKKKRTQSLREVAQSLVSTSSEQGLNREAWAGCIEWGLDLNALRTI